MLVHEAADRAARLVIVFDAETVGFARVQHAIGVDIRDHPVRLPAVGKQLAVHIEARTVVRDDADPAVLGGGDLPRVDRGEVVRVHQRMRRAAAELKVDVGTVFAVGCLAGCGRVVVILRRDAVCKPCGGHDLVALAVGAPQRCDQEIAPQQVFGVLLRRGFVIVKVEAARQRQTGLIRLVPERVEKGQQVVAQVHVIADDGLRRRRILTVAGQLVVFRARGHGGVNAEDRRQRTVLHPARVHFV